MIGFFEFDMNNNGHIIPVHNESLEMDEECLALDYSGKLLAVSLADNTVKMMYSDSRKLFVSLYGHSQPVTKLKFSNDGRLIATVSGDRDLRLWGTDFGDCHKKIYAHDDTITSLSWVGNSHYLFTQVLREISS